MPRQSTAVDRTRTCGLNASCCRHRQLPRECSQRSAYRRYTSTARCNDGRYDFTWRALVIQQWRDGSARLYHQSPLGIITTSLHVTVKVHHHRIAARPKSLPSAHQGTDAPTHRPTDPPTNPRTAHRHQLVRVHGGQADSRARMATSSNLVSTLKKTQYGRIHQPVSPLPARTSARPRTHPPTHPPIQPTQREHLLRSIH